MSDDTVRLMIALTVMKSEVEDFKRRDLFVIPHEVFERVGVLHALAVLEQHVEASVDEEARTAFRVIGEMFARAKVTAQRRTDA